MENQSNKSYSQYNFLGQHLVALQGSYERLDSNKGHTGSSGHFIHSGFIMSFHGNWLLVTAGHILQDLQENLEEGRLELASCYLIDYFGPDAQSRSPIPFVYNAAPKFFIYDEDMGLDFGLIGLSKYYQGLLERNKIIPFTEKDWASPEATVDFYMMIGIPESFVDTKLEETYFDVGFQAAIIVVTAVSDPPESMLKQYPRFIGRLGDIAPLQTMRGMSGAPILGFAKENNRYRYWIIAIQSTWLEPDLIAGCPITIFLSLLEQVLDGTE